MSVYIKGMKMPKGCATCPYCDRAWNNPKCKAKSVQGRFMEQRLNLDRTRQKWCPLAPVPDHGRLVDADAFERRCMFDSDIEDMQDVIYALRDYPTIIPSSTADKEGDG